MATTSLVLTRRIVDRSEGPIPIQLVGGVRSRLQCVSDDRSPVGLRLPPPHAQAHAGREGARLPHHLPGFAWDLA